MGQLIDEMISFGIPVIIEESIEEELFFRFGEINWEQKELVNRIIFGWPTSFTLSSSILLGDGIDELEVEVTGKPNNLINLYITIGAGETAVYPIQLDSKGCGNHIFSCETCPTKILFEIDGNILLTKTVRVL